MYLRDSRGTYEWRLSLTQLGSPPLCGDGSPGSLRDTEVASPAGVFSASLDRERGFLTIVSGPNSSDDVCFSPEACLCIWARWGSIQLSDYLNLFCHGKM